MIFVSFELDSRADVDDAWEKLSSLCIELLYSTEEPSGSKTIYGYLPSEEFFSLVLAEAPYVRCILKAELEEIDWNSQWQNHSLHFEDGLATIELHKYGHSGEEAIRMKAGPGFGDLSHPTTRLALRLMIPLVKDKFVIDIGCGSGVLALSAAALGAYGVHAIDIDPLALEHARDNARLNSLESKITYGKPHELFAIPSEISLLIVMNMIETEQIAAWQSLPSLHGLPAQAVTSGILEENERRYISLMQKQGWEALDIQSEEAWLGFQFQLVENRKR